MTLKPRLLILFFIILSLSACQQKGVLKTPEGILRKVVIRQDNTSLYDSTQLNNSVATVDQWGIFYVFGEAENYYVVSGDRQEYPEKPFYIKKTDVFEWNSFFCLAFKNSPHEANRSPIKAYETFEAARDSNDDLAILREYENHETQIFSVFPILKEHSDSVYRIAALYCNTDKDGNRVCLGDYAFVYVKYSENAFELRRYVSKKQLAGQLKVILGITGEAKPNLNPSEADIINKALLGVLVEFDGFEKAIADIINAVFGSGVVPSVVQKGPFDPEALAKNIENLDPQLAVMVEKMLDHIQNPANWNENGYTYIPVEWMEQ